MSFDDIGTDGGPDDPYVLKAVSDMKKDQILQRYQYFIENPEY